MFAKVAIFLLFCAVAVWSAARAVRRLEGSSPSMARRVLTAFTPVSWMLLGVAILALPPVVGVVLIAAFLTAGMFRVLLWALRRADGDDGWEPPDEPVPPLPRLPREKELTLSRNGDD